MNGAALDPEQTLSSEDRPEPDDAAAEPAGAESGAAEGSGDGAEAPGQEPPRPYVDPVVAALRAEVAARDEQLRSYITAYKEATADMQRERERMAKERQQLADVERMAIAGKLLEVLDDLDRSLRGCAPGAAVEDLVAGLELVRKRFSGALADLGVERTEGVGATFDAAVHEASGMIPAQPGQRDQEIVFEERAGYTYKGRLLRAARVVVASAG